MLTLFPYYFHRFPTFHPGHAGHALLARRSKGQAHGRHGAGVPAMGTAGPKLKVLGNSRTETPGTIDMQRDEMILDDLR